MDHHGTSEISGVCHTRLSRVIKLFVAINNMNTVEPTPSPPSKFPAEILECFKSKELDHLAQQMAKKNSGFRFNKVKQKSQQGNSKIDLTCIA